MLRDPPNLDEPLPGDNHSYRWRGMDIAYTTAGDPSAPDVVLLHGIHVAGSSVEFRGMWSRLSDRYHVIAPDLPGFGCSDRPPITYDGALYEAFIQAFTDDVASTPIGVASSLTAAFTATVDDDTFSDLVLICPTDTTTSDRSWLGPLFRTPGIGSLLFQGLTTSRSLRWWFAHEGYENAATIRPDLLTYLHRSARQPGARFAPAAFAAGDVEPDTRLVDTLPTLDAGVTLVWGQNSTRPPLELGETLASTVDCPLLVVDAARSLPHSEHPNTVLTRLASAGIVPRLQDA